VAVHVLGVRGRAGNGACPARRVRDTRRFGSLRSFDSAAALHALQPALRRPWACPGCGLRLVGSYGEVSGHVAGCEAVRGVEAQVCDCDVIVM
jgi:hypothetical protein